MCVRCDAWPLWRRVDHQLREVLAEAQWACPLQPFLLPFLLQELRRALAEAESQLASTRERSSDLEEAVAELSADVRRLRGQLRSSRDGLEAPQQAPAPKVHLAGRARGRACGGRVRVRVSDPLHDCGPTPHVVATASPGGV
jgi:hypothetical protein